MKIIKKILFYLATSIFTLPAIALAVVMIPIILSFNYSNIFIEKLSDFEE